MPEIEYGDVCSVVSLGTRHALPPAKFNKSAFRRPLVLTGPTKIVEGFACLWNRPHYYKGRYEVFERGCFNRSLESKSRIDFCIDHDVSFSLGSTSSNLELIDTKIGLAFRLKPSFEDLLRLDGRTSMSPRYAEKDVEVRYIEGTQVRFIKSAFLFEVSACSRGVVEQTHLVVRPAQKMDQLDQDCDTAFAYDGAFVRLQRALNRVQTSSSNQ